MKRLDALRHEFVEFIPDDLEYGVLYISIPYATTMHLCACGCGNQAVNPLAPHGWLLTFDGRAVSLSPSVGNWSFPCQSHYWIREDLIDWSGAMSREQIDAGRVRRRREIDRDYTEATASMHHRSRQREGWLHRLLKPFSRR